MALFIVMSTGDFQIHWNVMSLLFSERESGKWPLGLSDFFINILSAMLYSALWKDIHLQHLTKTIFIQQHDFFCRIFNQVNLQ